jgi:prepilin-type N-terminal cleavage/methylation domain-containing protein
MNMILKKQIANGWNGADALLFPFPRGVARSAGVIRRRTGFTLVEVIVVLVILAILAAIAIPALTGYIDKAEDKKYIAQARNAVVALRTVIDEEYAEGLFDANTTLSAFRADGIAGVDPSYASRKFKHFSSTSLGRIIDHGNMSGDGSSIVLDQVTDLLGISRISSSAEYFQVHLTSPNQDSYTILNAPGFIYMYFPEGVANGKPMIYVTNWLDLEPSDLYNKSYKDDFTPKYVAADYDLTAGYRVFHFTFTGW